MRDSVDKGHKMTRLNIAAAATGAVMGVLVAAFLVVIADRSRGST